MPFYVLSFVESPLNLIHVRIGGLKKKLSILSFDYIFKYSYEA